MAIQIKNTINPEAASILFISVLWVIMVLVANPIGDFPLNDDWAYAESVRTLLNDHKIVISDWSAPNLLAQVIWGWGFALVMGSSFTVLRVSVLVLGLLGVITAFKLSREIGVPLVLSVLGAVLLIVNPIYFVCSHTFMTDVPFFTFSTISLLFLTRAINKDNTQDIVLGTFALVLALLIRQLGFAIAIAYALAYIVGRRLSASVLFKASIPLLTCLVVQLAFRAWLNGYSQLPAMHGHQIAQIKQVLSLPILDIAMTFQDNLLKMLLTLALFLSPLILLVFFYLNEKIIGVRFVFFMLIAFLVYIIMRVVGLPLFPLFSNVVNAFGIGPMLQYGAIGYIPEHLMELILFWTLMGFIAVGATGIMLYLFYASVCRIWATKSEIRKVWGSIQSKEIAQIRLYILLGATTLIYCVPTFFLSTLFDRYLLLPMLTLSLLLQLQVPVIKKLTHLRLGVVVLMTTLAAIITSAVTHDYLAWNRVRWAALDNLVHHQGISPERIDGGFEFNGMFLFSKDQLKPGSKGWWVVDNEYLIAYSPIAGYVLEARYPVDAYLPFSPQNIFVLHRN